MVIYLLFIIYYLFNLHYSLYIPYLTFIYINILGSLLFILYLLQLISGILLSIYYNNYYIITFDSIQYIIININNGWFIRILHVIGAPLFILLLLLHYIKSIFYKPKIININNNIIIYITGYLLFILFIIEAFSGYLSCWGQMSYWGIIILINIIGILPFIGIIISKLIRSAVWVISNRIFLYHFLIGILISIILYFHIIILHNFSSINSYINNNTLIIVLIILIVIFDLIGIIIWFIIINNIIIINSIF